MKKIIALLMSLILILGLAAFINNQEAENTEPAVSKTESEANTLVVYFSMPETSEPDNMTQEEENSAVVIDGEVLGNTQYVASVIQENTGADIFRIEPETPYPTDHDTLVDLAAEEQDNNARPAIKDSIDNLQQYDTVFIGYPNWWGDMPMILYSFFDEYDFSGKTIIPFNTHGGSGFSDTISTIAELEPEANVNVDGFTVSRDNIQDTEPDIIAWLGNLDTAPSDAEASNTGGKTLVAYYSATGSTESVANVIASATGADLFELEPVEPYSNEDLDWTNDDSRVTKEHENESERDVALVAATTPDWSDYDTVFIGYPIWWGIAAWPVDEFIENNDFTGKTVIPFCTSASSGLGESGELLEEMAGTGDWQEGQRFRSGASEEDVKAWIEGLGL